MEKKDDALVRAVLAGDRGAYSELVERHCRALFRLAWRITGNEADADDVVQESFLRGYRRLEEFEGRAAFGTWIYRIAVRCAFDCLEARRGEAGADGSQAADTFDPAAGRVAVSDEAAGPERLLLSGEIAAQREMALKALTPVERAAFVLRHDEQLGSDEIGAALGIAPNTARQVVYRAVQKMRRRLAPLWVKA